MKPTLKQLKKVLFEAWSKETSYCPIEWNKENPSLGQCAVTALVINDFLGGEILWSAALQPDGKVISHYFNKIGDKTIDLTREQFVSGTVIPAGKEKKKDFSNTREFMLSDGSTRIRYEQLKDVVAKKLASD